jgi:hypothetical protein
VILKSVGTVLLFVGLFSIVAPPRFLGANGRKKAIAASLVGCALLIATDERPKPAAEVGAAQSALTNESQPAPSSQAPVLSSSRLPPARITELRQSLVSGERVEVVKVSAMSLFREYDQNEVATDMRLKGKIVEINGKITGINKDFWDSAYVELQTPNQFMSASVRPIAADIDKISRLRKGQFVTFRCENMGRFMGSPSGKKCVLMD